MYYVIHSKDPYLLARFCTELQMEGWEYPKYWEEEHPWGYIPSKWLAINEPEKHFGNIQFYNHGCFGYPTRFTLTSRNYTDVLEVVLTSKKK